MRLVVKIRSLYRVTRALVPHGFRHIVYLGLPTCNNLGDEAVFDATTRAFRGYGICPYLGTTRRQAIVSNIYKARDVRKVVCVGGGTLIGQPRLWDRLRDCLCQGYTAVTFGTGVRAPEFWGKYPSYQHAIHKWTELLQSSPLVSVRGPLSRRILRNHGIEAEVIGDPALVLANNNVEPKVGNQVVGINIGETGASTENTENLVRLISRFTKELLSQGWRIRFYAVCKADKAVLSRCSQELNGRVRIESHYRNAKKFIDSVQTCDMFVGMKLHSVVLAMCSHTPSIMLQYQPKCADFMESMELLDYNLRTDTCCLDDLLELFYKLLANTETVQQKMSDRCEDYKSRIYDFADKISQLIR